jgi:hypothetical protein
MGFALKVTLGADFRSKKWTLGASIYILSIFGLYTIFHANGCFAHNILILSHVSLERCLVII